MLNVVKASQAGVIHVSRVISVREVQHPTSTHVLQALMVLIRQAKKTSVSAFHVLQVTTVLRQLQIQFQHLKATTHLTLVCLHLSHCLSVHQSTTALN